MEDKIYILQIKNTEENKVLGIFHSMEESLKFLIKIIKDDSFTMYISEDNFNIIHDNGTEYVIKCVDADLIF